MASMESLHKLEDHLDSLILSYLSLFDTYQALQADISKHLSNGYFSLAQANFSSPYRGRYGEDSYDGRMTALRGVDITSPSDKDTFTLKDLSAPAAAAEESETFKAQKSEKGSSGLRNRKRPAASKLKPEGESVTEYAGTNTQEKAAPGGGDEGEDEDQEPISKPNLKDPIRWFGILTPPSLRTAQTEFTASLPPILSLCGLLREIERQEDEVRRVRKEVRDMRKELGVVVELPKA